MDENAELPEVSGDEWLRGLADAALTSGSHSALRPDVLPVIDRERPPRRPLVSKRVLVVSASVAVAALVVTLVVSLLSAANVMAAPDVLGMDLSNATTQLSRDGLEIDVVAERFSDEPAGMILSQEPEPGADLRRGEPIKVIVSAGTEEFVMPDVVGNGVALARGALEGGGLVVEVEYVLSETASDTVLSSNPAAGATVRTGDIVRLQVATPRTDDGGLQPFRMDGVIIRIDPAPSAGSGDDVTLAVARRLRALLEASGASVTMLRSTAGTTAADAARATAAAETSATFSVGFSLVQSGAAGRVVSSPPSMTAPIGPASEQVAVLVATKLEPVAPPVSRVYQSDDPVLSAVQEPWIRVALGSPSQRTDSTSFSDPRWADLVARAVYTSLGEVYGQPIQP